MAHDFLKLSIRKSREFSIFARASLFIFATQTFRVSQSRVSAAPASSRGCYCIINFQRTFWFHRDKNVHQSHSSSRRRGRPLFSPFLATNGTLSKYNPMHFSRGMQEISETYFNSPPSPPNSACDVDVGMWNARGILSDDGYSVYRRLSHWMQAPSWRNIFDVSRSVRKEKVQRCCESELPLVSA